MTKSSTFAKGALAAAAGLMALGVRGFGLRPALQRSGLQQLRTPCQRDASGRGVTRRPGRRRGRGGHRLPARRPRPPHRRLAAGRHRRRPGRRGDRPLDSACDSAPPAYSSRYGRCAAAPAARRPLRRPTMSRRRNPMRTTPTTPRRRPATPSAKPSGPMAATASACGVIDDRVGPDGCTVAESPVYMPEAGWISASSVSAPTIAAATASSTDPLGSGSPSGRPPHRGRPFFCAQSRCSRFPSPPSTGLSIVACTAQPASARNAFTPSRAFARASGSLDQAALPHLSRDRPRTAA